MVFNDDEQIASDFLSGGKPASSIAGKTKLTIINNMEAPENESKFKVMLEFTGAGLSNDSSGLDLVAVLDVSAGMEGEKLEKMKTAMQFVIRKLRSIDRLSVVAFSGGGRRMVRLRQMTENSKAQIENLVNFLQAGGSDMNIAAGLQKGLEVINDRSLTSGRVAAIMLLSNGQQNAGGDAAQVPIGNVPVFTFGFGSDHDPRVLKAIADNSMGGTFSDVQKTDNLSIAFSQCLAGLLTVVARDLKLTIRKVEEKSTIENVSAGNYPQSRDDGAGTVTVSFGDLYAKEVRKVIVDLLLPAVSGPRRMDVLQVAYRYSTGGRLFAANPTFATVTRNGTFVPQEEVVTEEIPLQIVQTIKEARTMANDKKLEDAKDKLVDAQNMLEDEESNPPIEKLKYELRQLLRLMKTQEIYEKEGRSFALSFESSQNPGTSLKREREEVMIEEIRLQTTRMIKEARVLADDKKLDDAQGKLADAQKLLKDVADNPMIEMLKSELQELSSLMKSQEIYEKQGRPFALSFESSQDRQRFAARGDVEKLRLFATPRMNTYLKQAKSFDEDPNKPLPTADEDLKQELTTADPLASIAGSLSYHLQSAIQSLQAMNDILNSSR